MEGVEKQEFKELLQSLPKEKGWRTTHVHQYQGFWYTSKELAAVLSFQHHFQALDDDLLLCTTPKSGTIWLKSLLFAIVNRNRYTQFSNPLLTTNPHVRVPFFEFLIYATDQVPDLSKLESPRLFSTHIPSLSLPEFMKDSGCRIVYLCRDPKDFLVSYWFFMNKLYEEDMKPLELEEAGEMFCKGVSEFGPFWDHVLGYWKLSLEMPKKVLFLKYEDVKEDTSSHVKKLAEFVGYPFSEEEDQQGVVDDILRLCNFENLSNLEVNKTGKNDKLGPKQRNSMYFRKGEVGDWRNHLTQEMAAKINHITEEKLGGSGLNW